MKGNNLLRETACFQGTLNRYFTNNVLKRLLENKCREEILFYLRKNQENCTIELFPNKNVIFSNFWISGSGSSSNGTVMTTQV